MNISEKEAEVLRQYKTCQDAVRTLETFAKEVLTNLFNSRLEFQRSAEDAISNLQRAKKTIPGAEEATKSIMQYGNTLHSKYPAYLKNMCFVYLAAIVENYLKNALRFSRKHGQKRSLNSLMKKYPELTKIMEIRNAILHADAKADKKFVRKTNNGEFKIGEDISVDFMKAIYSVEQFAISLCKDMLKEFCGISNPDTFLFAHLNDIFPKG